MGKLSESQKQQAIEQYASGRPFSAIARDFGVYPNAIRGLLVRRGIDLDSSRRVRTRQLNESYFDEIDSEEKAYWLGFLFADGSVSKYTLAVCLSQKDRCHVELFRKCIESDAEIDDRDFPDSCRLRLNSLKLVRSLEKLGCIRRKTFDLHFPDLDSSLLKHFFRGYFDGDGWFCYRKKRDILVWGVCCGSELFLEKLKSIIEDQVGSVAASVRPTGSGNAYQFVIEGMMANRVAEWMYDDATIFLNRKKDIYQSSR